MKKTFLPFLQMLSKTSGAPLWMASLTAAALLAGGEARAADFVTKVVTASGANWNAAVWSNGVTTTVSSPVAGKTYELIPNGVTWGNNTANSRLRNPATDGLQTFPGDSLTIDAN